MRYARPFSTYPVIAQQPTQVNGAAIAAPLVIQGRCVCVEHPYLCSDMFVRAAAIICSSAKSHLGYRIREQIRVLSVDSGQLGLSPLGGGTKVQ
jgi:hypothetical protein